MSETNENKGGTTEVTNAEVVEATRATAKEVRGYHEALNARRENELTPENAKRADAYMDKLEEREEAARLQRKADDEAKEKLEQRIAELETGSRRPKDGSAPQTEEQRQSMEDWNLYLRQKKGSVLARETMERLEKRTNTVGSNTGGGYLAPTDDYESIVEKGIAARPLIGAVETVNTDRQSVTAPIEDAFPTATWGAETATQGESTPNPSFTQRVIKAHNLRIRIQVSRDLIEDNTFNLVNFLERRAAVALRTAIQTAIVNGSGDGSNQALGLLNTATGTTISTGVTQAAGHLAFGADYLLDLEGSLPEEYDENAEWAWNRTTHVAVRKAKLDGVGYIFTPGFGGQNGDGPTVFGRRFHKVSDMPSFGASAKPIILADFKEAYWLIQRRGFTVDVDPYSGMDSNITRYYFSVRVGGAPMLVDAARVLATPAA